MKAWFISDLHLKNMQERNSQILLRFLRSLTSQLNFSGDISRQPIQIQNSGLVELPEAPTFNQVLEKQKIKREKPQHFLFLLGDIFDIWVSDHSIFVNEFLPIVEEIQLLCQKNFRIIYFEGNHDMHIDRFWTQQLGVEVYEGTEFFDIGGYKIRAEHGDLINKNDLKHLRSYRILHHPFIEFLGHNLPGFFWNWLAQRYSQSSRERSSHYRKENQEEIREMIRNHAQSVYLDRPFDLIISGHMHVFDDFEFNVGTQSIRSINLGSWLEEPRVLQIEFPAPEGDSRRPHIKWILNESLSLL